MCEPVGQQHPRQERAGFDREHIVCKTVTLYRRWWTLVRLHLALRWPDLQGAFYHSVSSNLCFGA
jgi:hypothetical protein